MSSKRHLTPLLLGALRRWLAGLALLGAAAGAGAAPQAQEVELKAAFVYNFALFTTWPQARADINFCLLGSEQYLDAFEKYAGRKVGNASVRVRQVRSTEEARSCEVVYFNRSENGRFDAIIKSLEGTPVLTIGESGVSDPAAVAILMVREGDRLTFEINQNLATSGGLVFSYKLLKLARRVR